LEPNNPTAVNPHQADAVKYTVQFSLFFLRACVTLNGGAILALLTFVTHQSTTPPMIGPFAMRIAIVLFAIGLICAAFSAERGYRNFIEGQNPSPNRSRIARYRCQSECCGIASLGLFLLGVIAAVFIGNT
jgi:hypothetical protein